jgi:hypothetical protein
MSIAFCLMDGSILSAPHDPDQTAQFQRRDTAPNDPEATVLRPAARTDQHLADAAGGKPILLRTVIKLLILSVYGFLAGVVALVARPYADVDGFHLDAIVPLAVFVLLTLAIACIRVSREFVKQIAVYALEVSVLWLSFIPGALTSGYLGMGYYPGDFLSIWCGCYLGMLIAGGIVAVGVHLFRGRPSGTFA